MGLTLLRQDDDIRQSDAYDDSIAPSLANYETSPTSAEDDLNSLRSATHTLLNRRTGNWYDDLLTPATFENGAQRAVNDLNQDLHDLERKRVLRCVWNIHSIAGGAGQGVILGAGELPSDTTAAVGAVTSLGTVVAAATTFGTYSASDIVAGASSISPKNLVQIVDASTRDPILDSGGRQVYGLLQSESATDGHTISATTPNRVQISYVVVSAGALALAAAGTLSGINFDYCSVERIGLEDLNEQDFLGGASVDLPAGSTVTRQVGYDNQGTTPVDLLTNATLDLEGAGLYWEIRDDLEATLFRITEGSAGGTSTLAISADVDTFDVDAIANDFANGASFDTAGTPIQVAETAGVVERAADLILRASGTGELYLDDSNQPGSWAQTDGIKLSETSAEWSDFETAFGGEVSLLNAIVAAYNAGADPVRTYHDVTAGSAITANNDIGGPSTTANNIDTDWPDAFAAGILDSWVFLNGRIMRPGANAAANNDYYPGTSFTSGNVEIKFERNVKPGDVFVSLYWP
jgi:hypothetical protein